jgi:uncharacterized protein (DUF1778 family)
MSRLSIEISGQQHQQIKAMAALKGISIKDYILQATLPAKREKSLEEELETEDERAAFTELMEFLKPRIVAAERGEFSTRTFDDILADALKRTRKQ